MCASLGRFGHAGADTVPDVLKLFVMIRGMRATLLIRDSQLAGTELAPWSYGDWILDEQDESLYEYISSTASFVVRLLTLYIATRQDPSPRQSQLPADIFEALRHLSAFFITNLSGSSRHDYEVAMALLRDCARRYPHGDWYGDRASCYRSCQILAPSSQPQL